MWWWPLLVGSRKAPVPRPTGCLGIAARGCVKFQQEGAVSGGSEASRSCSASACAASALPNSTSSVRSRLPCQGAALAAAAGFGTAVAANIIKRTALRSSASQSSGPRLLGGRPCGACGQLVEAEQGYFNEIGIFYCSDRDLCRQRCRIWPWSQKSSTALHGGVPLEAITKIRDKAHLTVLACDDAALRACLEVCPDISVRRIAHGRTLLHLAAAIGYEEGLQVLLSGFESSYGSFVELEQAVECYEDGFGATAGEYALAGGHQAAFDMLVESACARPRPSNFSTENNKAYVKQKLAYSGDVLLDEKGGGVMMGWEEPLMARHAELIAPGPGLSVLNVGFGLGLVDGFLQATQPRQHTIVEAHPDVYAEIQRRGWMGRQGVQVVHGRWQDMIEEVVAYGPYDGIFFDTYAEMYGDMLQFFSHLPRLLRPGGFFSYFNGLSDKNIFAQGISCRVAQMDLAKLGLACVFEPFEIGSVSDEEWQKVVNHYWSLETYYVPFAVMLPFPGATHVADPKAYLDFPATTRTRAVQVTDRVGKTLDSKLDQAELEDALIKGVRT